MVHPEVVLQGDGGVGLGGGLHFHVFFGLDSLVESVGVAAPFEDTTGLFVNNLDLVVHHHVFHVFLEEGVGFKQLVDGVHALRFHGEVAQHFVFLLLAGVVVATNPLNFGYLGSHVGQHEEVGIVVGSSQEVETFFGEFNGVLFFVDHEEEFIVDDVHVFRLLLHVEVFDFLQQGFHARFAQEFDEGFVFGQTPMRSEQQFASFALVFVGGLSGEELFGFGQYLCYKVFLHVVEPVHVFFHVVEELVFAFGCRSRDDEGCTGIVDQHRVNLVNYGEVVFSLHQFVRVSCHIVTQVVETEFVVGAVGDVGVVGGASGVAVGLVLVDAIHLQSVELEEHPHPFRVAFGKVVVHGHQVHTFAWQRVEIDGQRGYQCFPFAGGHLGNFPFVKHNAADELHIVVHHIPFDDVAAGHPRVAVASLVALNHNVVAFYRQVAIAIGGSHLHPFVFFKTAAGFFHHREGFGEYFQQDLLCFFEHAFLQRVDLLVKFFALVHIHIGFCFDAGLESRYLFVFLPNKGLYALPELVGHGTQVVVAKQFDLFVGLVNFCYQGHDFFEVAVRLGAEEFFNDAKHGYLCNDYQN